MACCTSVIVIAIAGLPVYVRPQIDRLRPADAIFILGGVGTERYSYGIELAEQGWAPNLAVSNPSGANSAWLKNVCANPPPGVDMHCFVPNPPTTKGEALELRRLASLHGWRTVIVVTFRPHVSRARFILERCFDGNLVMVESPTRITTRRFAFEYVYQTTGYVRAILQPGCESA